MKRALLVSILWAACASAIGIPRVGYTRDAQGLIRPLDGVSGNFLIGDALLADDAATAFAWNGTFGIRKTDSSLEWWDATASRVASIDANPGVFVLGFDATTAFVYTTPTGILAQLTLSQNTLLSTPIPITLADNEQVLAIAGRPNNTVDLALQRPDGISITTFDRSTGSRLNDTPLTRTASQVFLLNDGSIAGIDGSSIWIQRPGGTQWTFDTGTPLTTLAPMAANWLQAGPFALKLAPEPKLYQIPEAAQQ